MSDYKEKKSFLSIFEELGKKELEAAADADTPTPDASFQEEFSLTDELDHEILMHRDAHFAGDFDVMLTYYQDEGIGCHPEIEYDRIAYLANVEQELGQNLAPLVLTATEAERVARARRAYEMLKQIYEVEESKNPFPRLLADLILTEDEDAEEEIDAIVAYGNRIVPELLILAQAEEGYDPLFPGYGYAPYLAMACLGKIEDPKAIVSLFELLGNDLARDEEAIVSALRQIGEESKTFLLNVLKSRPLTNDNIQAAYALTAFGDQLDVAITCFEQLCDPEVLEKPQLRVYLLCSCDPLQETPFRDRFIEMGNNPEVPEPVRTEIQEMIKHW